MPKLSVAEFIELTDGPDALNPLCWLYEHAILSDPADSNSPLTLPHGLYRTTKYGASNLSIEYPPGNQLNLPGATRQNKHAKFTITGVVNRRGTCMELIGSDPPDSPIEIYKLEHAAPTMAIRAIDCNLADYVKRQRNMIVGAGCFQEMFCAAEPTKPLRRSLIGNPLEIDEECIQLVFPATYVLPIFDPKPPSPSKRGHLPSKSARSATPPPSAADLFNVFNPGPPDTLYPPVAMPGYYPGLTQSPLVKVPQRPFYDASGDLIHPGLYEEIFVDGVTVRVVVVPSAGIWKSGLYCWLRIIELQILDVDLEDYGDSFDDSAIPTDGKQASEYSFDDGEIGLALLASEAAALLPAEVSASVDPMETLGAGSSTGKGTRGKRMATEQANKDKLAKRRR